MPPSLKNPSEQLLLKVLTSAVGALGSLIVAILILAWNGIDSRLSNIEDSFLMVEGTVITLQTEYRDLDRRVDKHEYLSANGK